MRLQDDPKWAEAVEAVMRSVNCGQLHPCYGGKRCGRCEEQARSGADAVLPKILALVADRVESQLASGIPPVGSMADAHRRGTLNAAAFIREMAS